MAYAVIEITEEMKTAREECSNYVMDCDLCPCRMGEEDCIFNHNVVE